jgi:hypothetical protein
MSNSCFGQLMPIISQPAHFKISEEEEKNLPQSTTKSFQKNPCDLFMALIEPFCPPMESTPHQDTPR